jgi:prepilin-type N-terminal cleavage/methylation domain-containing protein
MKSRGFSIIELLIAVAIFVILSAVITISSARARDKAKNAAIAGAARTLAVDQVAPYVSDHPGKLRWGGAKRERFLNGRINLALTRPGRSNVYNYKNPATGSERIRVGGNAGSPAAAVLITNRKKYRYDQVVKRASLLKRSKGLIVLWMSRAEPGVEVYYIDMLGRVSDFHWTN